MKILLTGYKGFIGQNFLQALQKEDGHEIYLFEWGDEEINLEGLDWVVHLGAISSTSESNVEKIMIQNYDFSMWLLGQCIKHKVNFQYSSSASVYGWNRDFREDAPKDPRNPYAWSKYLFDRDAFFSDDIIIQGFRYFNVHGPYEDHKGHMASPHYKFEKQAKEEKKIQIFEGSNNFKRDFIHVDNVVNIHMAFMNNVKESGVWNVGSGKAVSFKEVAEDIASKYDAEIEELPFPPELKMYYQDYTCADLTKLKSTLDI
jgi:ADP-L-glycero-D-manno-heptose 6-epimerase